MYNNVIACIGDVCKKYVFNMFSIYVKLYFVYIFNLFYANTWIIVIKIPTPFYFWRSPLKSVLFLTRLPVGEVYVPCHVSSRFVSSCPTCHVTLDPCGLLAQQWRYLFIGIQRNCLFTAAVLCNQIACKNVSKWKIQGLIFCRASLFITVPCTELGM